MVPVFKQALVSGFAIQEIAYQFYGSKDVDNVVNDLALAVGDIDKELIDKFGLCNLWSVDPNSDFLAYKDRGSALQVFIIGLGHIDQVLKAWLENNLVFRMHN